MRSWRISGVVLCLCLLGCDGCKEQAGALLGKGLPALPRLTSWETHLRAFSMVATKPPKAPLRYRVSAGCPLVYDFLWVHRSNAAVFQKRKGPRKFVETRVFGRLAARARGAKGWQLGLAWMRVKRAGTPPKTAPKLMSSALLLAGPMTLQTDGRAWSIVGKAHRLWDAGPQQPFALVRFWPELAKTSAGHTKDIKRTLPGGWLKARSFTKHWLMLRGEQVGVMVEQMQVKRRKVQLDHSAEYAMVAKGHLLYARFRHRNWVLDPGRGDEGRTETSVEGELRLQSACHKLRLAPFLAKPPAQK